ncbi:MATE family efflux transporter [Rugamonas sp. CCM 8940]|uniref:MATE family efflux transporter n=1 Tax=Rugamonas sp. CCM 8940 TaxID=2765359 RepID=UPI0018F6F9E7|nr:MATE family efflux transporter [Rugamonas sp. CCM 8940]MBJ7312501.1 MATE family efflux transporter [Rugamonas sp. CCM 8940]
MTVAQWRLDGGHIAALAGPLILTQFAQVALSTVGILMMGLLGPLDIAAGGLALAVFNLLRTMGVGLVTPTGNLVAAASARAGAGGLAAAGSEAEAEIRAMVRASFAIATLAGLLFCGLMLGAGPLLLWLGQDAVVVAKATAYLAAAAPGILPLLWFQVVRNFTVGLRRPGPLLAITIGSVALSAGLNLVLMYGAFGLPALGLAGIAWSSTLVQGCSLAVFLLVVRRDPLLARCLSLRWWRSDRGALLRCWKMGWPVAATYGSEAGFFAVVLLLVGAVSADALAAHTVVNQLVYIVFMISVGLSHAASISISKVWAQGDVHSARRYGHTGLAMGLACMALIGVVYCAVPTTILGLFLGQGVGVSAEAMALAAQLLTIAAVLQFFDCAQNIGIGILRGAGETGSSLWMTLIGYWGVGLPTAWLLGRHFGWGAGGVWIGLTLGLVATAGQLLLRFERLMRQRLARDGEGKMVLAP